MTYLLIALGVLREIVFREPRCVAALVMGALAVLLTARARLAVATHGLVRRGAAAAADGRVTAPVR